MTATEKIAARPEKMLWVRPLRLILALWFGFLWGYAGCDVMVEVTQTILSTATVVTGAHGGFPVKVLFVVGAMAAVLILVVMASRGRDDGRGVMMALMPSWGVTAFLLPLLPMGVLVLFVLLAGWCVYRLAVWRADWTDFLRRRWQPAPRTALTICLLLYVFSSGSAGICSTMRITDFICHTATGPNI